MLLHHSRYTLLKTTHYSLDKVSHIKKNDSLVVFINLNIAQIQIIKKLFSVKKSYTLLRHKN